MQAVILAGGAGTRLRPTVSDRPKPMADFGARPFLEYQVESLQRAGITDLVFCVGYMREHIQAYFGAGDRWGVTVRYSIENEPLGTGGALRHAASLLAQSFLLLNGDSYLQLDLAAFIAAHRVHIAADPHCVATMALAHVEDASPYGAVQLGPSDRLFAFGEKSRAGPAWVSAGIYAFEARFLELLPDQRPLSLEHQGLPAALAAGAHFYGHAVSGFFVDIGTPAGHHTFRNFVEGNTP